MYLIKVSVSLIVVLSDVSVLPSAQKVLQIGWNKENKQRNQKRQSFPLLSLKLKKII